MTSFFFNDTATTEIYTLSLHDALPISRERRKTVHAAGGFVFLRARGSRGAGRRDLPLHARDRKSTRLNSSHANISYAVFCLKKNKRGTNPDLRRRVEIGWPPVQRVQTR